MIIAWLIGVILNVLILWFLKHSVKVEYVAGYERIEGSVLKMWHVIIAAIFNLLPIINIIVAVVFMFWWLFDFDIKFKCPKSKLLEFLNKPIS